MCTLVVAASMIPGHPLVVVANRDESLTRPATPPFNWAEGFLAPRDDLAGGTWLGVNRHGVFVGITNRYLGPTDRTRVSRGQIVVDALHLESARAIHEAMSKVDPARHNGFHLVYADSRDVLATVSDGSELAQLTLGEGLSFATERSFGAGSPAEDDRARVHRIISAWDRLVPRDQPFSPERLTSLLAEHDETAPLSSTCIHLPGIDYGTRSALVLAIGADRKASRMLWAEGSPCTAPFHPVDLSGLGW